MTELEYQTKLHALYQGDTTTPTEGDEDWDYREALLGVYVDSWDNEEGIFWNELFKLNSTAQTQTGDGSDTTFATPADFRMPCSFVVTTNAAGNRTYYNIKKATEIELHKGTSDHIVYFTGNASAGFVLNFISAPASGDTIDYPYYKTPTAPTASASIIEMSDPYYALYMALSKLHENDGEGDRAILALQQAQQRMKNMRIRNELPAFLQMSAIPDAQFNQGVKGFGY